MERKTNVDAQEGRQELTITREFDLPLSLLFRAYVEAELVEQWMGTTVLKLESRRHGSYQLETTDPQGNRHPFHGVIHDLVPEQKIVRTFEMENTPVGVMLELLQFEALTEGTSKLTMRVIYESTAARDQVIQYGFVNGINAAHNRIQKLLAA